MSVHTECQPAAVFSHPGLGEWQTDRDGRLGDRLFRRFCLVPNRAARHAGRPGDPVRDCRHRPGRLPPRPGGHVVSAQKEGNGGGMKGCFPVFHGYAPRLSMVWPVRQWHQAPAQTEMHLCRALGCEGSSGPLAFSCSHSCAAGRQWQPTTHLVAWRTLAC
ncbi:hypothetical protein MTBUT4_110068 [Magnetospirillum sp. UT-4]|nr:hypothetical protein MTBUT4_110068 [Magnetospirillum sp. UT-4]